MKEIVEQLLEEKMRTKRELIDFMRLSEGGFYSKMKNSTWKKRDLELLSQFFNVPIETFTGQVSQNTAKSDAYLHDYLRKIEQEWKSVVNEKNKTIENQQYLINMMQQQLTAALGKEWHSEEELPVRHLDTVKLKPLTPRIYAEAS